VATSSAAIAQASFRTDIYAKLTCASRASKAR
jgi:hypothetical protein